WADLSEGHYGFSILNDCKYGHSVKDGDFALTLIKSGIEPNPTTDQEEHYFTYSIYPHGGTWREADTVQEAYKVNQPLLARKGGKPGEETSFVKVDQKNIILETIKMAEDETGVILRLYDSENAKTKARLTFEQKILSVCECNLMEEEIEKTEASEYDFQILVKPYEIKTYKIRFQ
ncbi:MAG: alpha-mannosidase, partial [Clostridiales bacterium]|nr:alpha-mannosidase [Clostridiales bacterium]